MCICVNMYMFAEQYECTTVLYSAMVCLEQYACKLYNMHVIVQCASSVLIHHM